MTSRGFWDRFLDMLFGESAHPEAARWVLGAPLLSIWLPYRSFDKKHGMFINTDSIGFILELAPMMGADERSGELLTQFLSDAVPPGCEIQLIHWQSPSVGERIADWVMPRVVAKGVYGRAAMHRARWLRRAATAWISGRTMPAGIRSSRQPTPGLPPPCPARAAVRPTPTPSMRRSARALRHRWWREPWP